MPFYKNENRIFQNSHEDRSDYFMTKHPIQIFFMAIRPKTLWASFCPVMIGTAMAYGDGVHHWPSAFVALAGAMLIQMGTNLANDYFDYKRGTDTQDRIGPVRVTQAGLIRPMTMIILIILIFLLAGLASLYLIQRAGWPITTIAILSIISGLLYTAGPFPLGYIGLGEIFVLIFFGPVAVGGTYYVQSLEINPAVIIAGLAPGFFSVAILTVNNLRDLEGDKRSGKKTLAVRFGQNFAMTEYFFAVIIAGLIPVGIHALTESYPYSLLGVLTILFTFPAICTVLTKSDGPALNDVLAYTGKLLFFYTLLFSVGWLL